MVGIVEISLVEADRQRRNTGLNTCRAESQPRVFEKDTTFDKPKFVYSNFAYSSYLR